MAAKLDRTKPYGQIFGIHEYGAVFEQFGHTFDAEGNEVGPGVSEKPAEPPPRVAAAGPAPTPPEPEAAPDLAAELEGLHPAQIKKLVEEAGLTPFGGAGAKAKNIQLLLDANG